MIRISTIDGDDFAVKILIINEHFIDGGEFMRLAEASGGNLALNTLSNFEGLGFLPVGIDESGSHSVDTDIIRNEELDEVLDEGMNSGLGNAVSQGEGMRSIGHTRAGEKDTSTGL